MERVWKPGTIVSSNTSGISIHAMVEGRSEEFRKHFLGTHFFNPPRYMKLLEIIPTEATRPDILEEMKAFAEEVLGKGVVISKDTPNFIANRIGVYGLQVLCRRCRRPDWGRMKWMRSPAGRWAVPKAPHSAPWIWSAWIPSSTSRTMSGKM